MKYFAIALLAVTVSAGCSPSQQDKHWDEKPALTNEQIAAQINFCWKNHLLPTQQNNSFGETVSVECYIVDGTSWSNHP